MAHTAPILAATDFSDASDAAIAQAARLANATGAPLHVLHTSSNSTVEQLAAFFPRTKDYGHTEQVEALRDRIGEQLKAAGAPEAAQVHIHSGNPFRAIADAIKEFSPGLLVIGSTGESGRRLGTIGGRCVRHADCDVLLIPAGFDRAFAHITACVDFSDLSPSVIRNAAEFAARDNASLVALYAHERVDQTVFVKGPSLELIDMLPGVIAARFDDELRPHAGDVPITFTMTMCGSFSDGIIRFAEESKTDLVVTGTTGRSGFAYMLLGTTAEKVIREVGCPVLAVKPDAE